jgi:hypothetical protein
MDGRLVVAAAGLCGLLAGCAGPGAGPGAGRGGGPEGLPPWSWQMPECVAYRPAELAAPAHRRSVRVHQRPDRTEQVEVYEAGWGARAVAEIRTVLRECGRYESGAPGDPAGFLAQHRVVDASFAGDESLLVETVHLIPPEVQTWYAAVVRYGDRVITLRTKDRTAAQTRCLVVAGPATCA